MPSSELNDFMETCRQKLKLGTPPNIIIESCKSYLKRSKSEPDYIYFITLGESYSEKNDFKNAVFFYTKALQLRQEGEVYFLLGREYFEHGSDKQAILFIQKALEKDKSNIDIMLLLANVYIKLGKTEEIFSLTKRMEDGSSKIDEKILSQFRSGMIRIFLKHRMYKEAHNMAKEDVDKQKGNHTHYEAMGISLLQMGDYKKASTYLEKSRSMNPQASQFNMPTFEEKVKELGNIPEKIQKIETTMEQNSEIASKSEKHFDLGFLYFYQGQHRKAVSSFKRALDLKLKAI